jgi:ABC-type nitrate/sulfonate/bicarbonate transport system permease component
LNGETTTTSRGAKVEFYSRAVLENLLPIAILLGIWEFVSWNEWVPTQLFPRIFTIFITMVEEVTDGVLVTHVSTSIVRLLISVFFALIAGTIVGILMGASRTFEWIFVPVVNFFSVIPGIALFPATILFWGLTEQAVVITISFATSIPIILNTWVGVKTVNETLVHAARSMETKGLALLVRVLLPGSLPVVIAGWRIGIARAWRVLLAGELLASPEMGLGVRIFDAQETLNSAVIYGGIIIIGFLGFAMERLVLRSLEVATVQRWGMMREL